MCKCICGNYVSATAGELRGNKGKKSCGCLNTEARKRNVIKMGYNNKQPLEQRFFTYIKKTKTCWNWFGDIGVNGYGRFWYEGKTVYAHRLSYMLHKGEITNNLCILHICDNPKCVNPKHLFLGTNKKNTTDRNNKGRQARGEFSGMAKLKEKDILQIRQLYEKGE